jgi:hypothetical protein
LNDELPGSTLPGSSANLAQALLHIIQAEYARR